MEKPTIHSYYKCDQCRNIIFDTEEGYHITGNIKLADPDPVTRTGLVGSSGWLEKINNGELVTMDDIPELVLCNSCLRKALAL